MNTFYLETVFTFGKYEGDTVEEIAAFDPSYIEWCIIELDGFYIDEGLIQKLTSTYENFWISDEAIKILEKKKLKR